MIKEGVANKLRLFDFSFIELTIKRILSCKKRGVEIIGFKSVFRKLGTSYQLPREQIWKLLYSLSALGLIEIIPFHGVVISDKLVEDLRNEEER